VAEIAVLYKKEWKSIGERGNNRKQLLQVPKYRKANVNRERKLVTTHGYHPEVERKVSSISHNCIAMVFLISQSVSIRKLLVLLCRCIVPGIGNIHQFGALSLSDPSRARKEIMDLQGLLRILQPADIPGGLLLKNAPMFDCLCD